VVIHTDTSCLGLSVTRRAWLGIGLRRQDDGVSRSRDAEPSGRAVWTVVRICE